MSVDNDPGKKTDTELEAERAKIAEQLRTERDPEKRQELQARSDEIDKERLARPAATDKERRQDSKPGPAGEEQASADHYNEIRREPSQEFVSDGKRYRVDRSEMTYDRENMKNARATPEGRSEDRKAREGVYAETGRDAAHRHSLSGNADPSDRENIYPGNSIQNRAGGTKAQIEKQRDSAIRDGSATSVNEESARLYARDRPGYGDRTPVAEEVTQTYKMSDGSSKTVSTTFGNFPSSGSRYADAQAAKGEKTDPEEMNRLHQQDKQHFHEQGHGTAKQSQQHVMDLKDREAKGENVQWGPRLAVDNTQEKSGQAGPPPRPKGAAGFAGPPSRESASEPNPPSKGPDKSR